MGQARKISQALVVGSREDSRQIASTLIEESGFHVIEAENVDEAVELLSQSGRRISFVFADAASPEDARKLTALIARKWPSIRVLVSLDRAAMDRAELPPSASRLHRPWRPLDLLIEAERAMN
jgi:CheY-like chemotaxis protein